MKMKFTFTAMLYLFISISFLNAQMVNDLKLKNYRPKSIFKTPITHITKSKYTAIDMHSHDYLKTDQEIEGWVKLMDETGIEKTIILSMATGGRFDSIYNLYSRYKNRFEIWCGFDYSEIDKPGFIDHALKELERCYIKGARGVGELGDKGVGEIYSYPKPGIGLHINDSRIKPLFTKCAELGMPVNVHIAEPIWMFETMDSTNDGLMNGFEWKVDQSQKDFIGFEELIKTLEDAVRENPKTTFIACHYANCNHDLEILGKLLDKYPNLYADISARLPESSVVPRYTASFHQKYQDRLIFGTDNFPEREMYQTAFRVIESLDEHFYNIDLFGYHWALNGLGLPDKILKKLYYTNAKKILDAKK